VAFSPDGKTLATGSGEGTYLWDVRTGHLVETLNFRAHYEAFSPNVKTAATVGERAGGVTYLWNMETGRRIATLTDQRWHFTGDAFAPATFSPDGKTLAAGENPGPPHGITDLWNVETKRRIATLADPKNSIINSIAFSPDGKTLATAGRKTYLWDVATRRRLATLTDPDSMGVNSLAFSRVELALGQFQDLTLHVTPHWLSSWSSARQQWVAAPGRARSTPGLRRATCR